MSHPIQKYLDDYFGFPSGYLLAKVLKNTPNTFQKLTQIHQTVGDGKAFADMVHGMVEEALRHDSVRWDAPELPHALTEQGQRDHEEYLKSLDRRHRQQQERFWNGGAIDYDYKGEKEKYLEAHQRNTREWLQKATEYYRSNDVPVPEQISGFAKVYGVEDQD